MGQIFLLVFLTYLLLVALKMRKFAPWLPTRNRDIERIVRIMNIQKNDVCYELGSGDGRVSVYLAKESEASVIGIEVFPLLHAIAMLRARFGVGNKPRLICSDIFQTDFSDATHIYLFGMPESLQGVLTTHLQNSLRKGTIIISYIYPYPDFSLERVDRGAEGKANPIWIYRV